MREKELRESANCQFCGQPFGHTGLPFFWRVKLTRYGVDLDAIKRQSGLEMFLGSPELAGVMGPDEEMAKAIIEKEVTICEECASTGNFPLQVLMEN